MSIAKKQYNPAHDTYLSTLFLDKDDDGNHLDVDSMLYHSEGIGFYLVRTIIQVWHGRTWETATNDEAESALREHRRSLKVFRPLTKYQAIRLILETAVPEEEKARELAVAAIDAAGIR
jgi:hypothetical protein